MIKSHGGLLCLLALLALPAWPAGETFRIIYSGNGQAQFLPCG